MVRENALRIKCPYLELFWSAFFPHFLAFELNMERFVLEIRIQEPNARKCAKNADQNNSEYGHYLCSEGFFYKADLESDPVSMKK